ncbi:predicted protein [Streptomyces viridosporus ATCC 14672]|uniref:Predicted protein n=1 Tax=Streptomyces viridosporus (strain ATCC 14672 / DSM 40746 / JCM 4963 / KCTC 9882 / NRRL B-12104 / FH 1290) TaxID=566461 RepID=D6A5M4_STRV1|nr:predicted protein [Streptomyces viridosporus ATCC 14672]
MDGAAVVTSLGARTIKGKRAFAAVAAFRSSLAQGVLGVPAEADGADVPKGFAWPKGVREWRDASTEDLTKGNEALSLSV